MNVHARIRRLEASTATMLHQVERQLGEIARQLEANGYDLSDLGPDAATWPADALEIASAATAKGLRP